MLGKALLKLHLYCNKGLEDCLAESYRSVRDYWVQGVGWDWVRLEGLLPDCSSGQFSISSAYSLAIGGNTTPSDSLWMKIWKLKVPARIRSFLWLIKHNRVMCNEIRVKRGFTSNGSFVQCPGALETIEHVLRFCPAAVEVWSRALTREELLDQDGLDFDSWLRWNLVRPIQSVFTEE
ncbi:hypothetical protein PTKIN_Ptkin05aG0048700 [Pterospermum kingtungense]